MSRDYTVPLWLLKLGALLNVYFLAASARRSHRAGELLNAQRRRAT
jgi:hypothetical protein